MKATISFLSLVLLTLACSPGCNTVKGLGKDVTTLGEKSEELITKDKPATNPS